MAETKKTTSAKKPEAKKTETKKQEAKKPEAKKQEVKKQETKSEVKKAETKKPEPKKAEPKKEEKKQTKKEQKHHKSEPTIASLLNDKWSLNKVSFFVIFVVAVLYLINSLLAILQVNLTVIGSMQAVCSAVALGIVGFMGWNYIKHKADSLKITYIILLLLVFIGIIVPVIMQGI